MANDELTPSDNAILITLMAEARAMLNTELIERYGIDVEKSRREKLNRLRLVRSVRSGRTYLHELDDKGWVCIQDQLDVSSPKARAIGGALAAVHINLVERVMPRSGYRSLGEMFARVNIASGERPSNLEIRLRNTYAALATEPAAWVALARLRPFFADVDDADLDEALLRLSRASDVDLVPENNQKILTDTDRAASIRVGGQDKHLLAIGVR
ncbi:hypothetical protein [Frankia sp. AvcI1]|uniref:hypothetical protein n=1 Tax=Frankia sp. AvcI1 TaxID=573496 RepID=UPI002119AE0B|nr:hypothetical protein [Frankia sp. AvcI1]